MTSRTHLALALALVVLGVLVAGQVWAGGWALPDPTGDGARASSLDSCTTITEPGRYVLASDIGESKADTCIRIRASDVVLDGDGHAIGGVGAFGTAGVVVRSDSGRPLSNVTVRDVTVTDWDDGVRFVGADDGAVVETVTADNRVGLSLLDANRNRLEDNVARSNRLHGVSLLETSAGNTLVNNTATENALFGFHLVEAGVRDNALRSNAATDNEFGFALVGVRNNTLARNEATANRIAGIWLSAASDNRLARNTVSNRFYGLYLSDRSNGNAVTNNTAESNAVGVRLYSSDGNAVTNNVVRSSSDTGILLISSDDNTVVGNRGSDNARGFSLVRSTGNAVRNNSLEGTTAGDRSGSRVGTGEVDAGRADVGGVDADEAGAPAVGAPAGETLISASAGTRSGDKVWTFPARSRATSSNTT